MSGLEITASAVVSLVFISFLTAWHAEGEAGEKYRDTVHKTGWFMWALATYPTGKAIGLVAWMAKPFSGRIRYYQNLRAYRGRHFDGMESTLILAEC